MLLISTYPEYNPEIKGMLGGWSLRQRAFLKSVKYAGRSLKCITKIDRSQYCPGRRDKQRVFWYLLNPPVGTASIVQIQHRCDNGGESGLSAYALNNVDQDNPFDTPLPVDDELKHADTGHKGMRLPAGKVITRKCRPGGLVVSEVAVYKGSTLGPEQTIRYANNHCRIGSTASGSPSVKLSWSHRVTHAQDD